MDSKRAGAARKLWEAFGEGTARGTPEQKWFRTFEAVKRVLRINLH